MFIFDLFIVVLIFFKILLVFLFLVVKVWVMEFGLLGVMVIVFGEMCIELIFIDFDVVYWFVIKFENIRRERERMIMFLIL